MNKSYYYLNEARDVLGPVSEETLKELQKVGVLGATSQICEQGTETWLQFSDVFPDAIPSSKAVGASSASPLTSPPPITGTAGTPPPMPAVEATPPPMPAAKANPPPMPAAKANPPAARKHQAPSSGTGKNLHLKPILIGCGALALLAVVGMIGLGAIMAAGGGDSSSTGSTSSASSYGGGHQTQYAHSPCRRCGGGGQLMERCTQCNGNGTIMTGVNNALDPDRMRSWNQNAPMQVPCPRCRGAGRMPVPCSHCRGTGRN